MFASNPAFAATRHRFLLASSLLLGLAPLASQATDAAYPAKPITLIVPYPAGGANDAVGRIVGQKMGEILKQSVIVDNRGGAGTTIGTALAAKAPGDGYTLVLGSLSSHAISPHLYRQPGYDAIKDFAPVGMIGEAPIVLEVATNSPFKDVKQVVEQTKKTPATLTYGSAGNGSPLHLSAELFKRAASVDMTHVPYKGGNAHTMDLMGGRIDMIFDTLTSATPLITSGKVRPLAVASTERLPELPNVPTFAESGYPNFVVNAWYALYAPAKTSPEVLAKLHQALNETLADADAKDRLTKLGVRSKASTQDELAKFTKAELDRYGSVISAIGLKID
jgi:tripartite-type tricarboxylate transporter receptor subunit TctC